MKPKVKHLVNNSDVLNQVSPKLPLSSYHSITLLQCKGILELYGFSQIYPINEDS